MSPIRTRVNLLSAVAMLFGMSATDSAFAYTTGIPNASRSFTLDSTRFFSGEDDDADSLLSFGEGNITANPKRGNIPEGWVVLADNKIQPFSDDSNGDDDRLGAVALFTESSDVEYRGAFSVLDSGIWNRYSNIAIGLKVGRAKFPDWVIIELEQFARAGIWSTNAKQGGALSHYLVYGKQNFSAPANPVPVPAAFWMLGFGLVGMLVVARKKPAAVE